MSSLSREAMEHRVRTAIEDVLVVPHFPDEIALVARAALEAIEESGWKLIRAHNLHDVPLETLPGGAREIADPGS